MGVPAFFRWLSDKFPKVVTQAVEEKAKVIDGVEMLVDTTKPNPNGEEFDNLYLDMNGIIHPCCHPENKPAPPTEDDMMIAVFEYLDRIVNIVRPRQLLYMAIDGVAPRAKMNQQRSRRFRAAQLAQIEREAEENVKNQLNAIGQGHQLTKKEKHFDSNCITPGTPFMSHLATCLRYHIAEKQNNDPLWRNLKVILSDATVPGEGEHKIVEYIRVQRSLPDHNPNTCHVIYGLDADLIMLALATHEPHFKIIREDVFFQEGNKKKCTICNRSGHDAARCRNKPNSEPSSPPGKAEEEPGEEKPYVFLHVNILREYLEQALKLHVPGVEWDFERAIDDWVFMCFFVGNDFLPHLPSLEIREEAISRLSLLWKQSMPIMGGYMTHNGNVDLNRVQTLVSELGRLEDGIFAERKEKEERRANAAKRRKLENERRKDEANENAKAHEFAMSLNNEATLSTANQNAAAALKAELMGNNPPPVTSAPASEIPSTTQESEHGVKRKLGETTIEEDEKEENNEEEEEEEEEEADPEVKAVAIIAKAAEAKKAKDQAARDRVPDDAVRLWEPGYKERYYRTKFGVEVSDREFINDIVKSYCEGLCWVFKYYYKGCSSWSWYYPYYYAPMASDFIGIGSFDIQFDLNAPLKPFEQLMGVLPSASRDHIPNAFHPLMIGDDSPILDFYPTDFDVDMDGKKWEWQGVVKLPFIDTGRLLESMSLYYMNLSDEEKMRNSQGESILFVSEDHQLYNDITKLYTKRPDSEHVKINPRLSGGMTGGAGKDDECIPHSTLRNPLPEHDLPDIVNDKSISVTYILPELPPNYVFSTKLLKGYKPDKTVLGYEDMQRATFEKTDYRRQNNRGWVSQMQHMEDYRDYKNTSKPYNRDSHRSQYNDNYRGGGGAYRHNSRGRGGGNRSNYPYPPSQQQQQQQWGYYPQSSDYNGYSSQGYSHGNQQNQSHGHQYGGYGYNAYEQRGPPQHGDGHNRGSYGGQYPPRRGRGGYRR